MEQMISNLSPVVLVLAFAAFWIWKGMASARSHSLDRGRRWRNLVISAIGFAIGGLAAAGLLGLSTLVGDIHWGLGGH